MPRAPGPSKRMPGPSAILILCLLATTSALPGVNAHLTISPSSSDAGAEEIYTLTVYGERPPPTTKVELVVPRGFRVVGVEEVSGWSHEILSGEDRTLIVWRGVLPFGWSVGLRFRALNPDEPGVYKFLGHQTYLDGNLTTWDWEGMWVEIKGGSSQIPGPGIRQIPIEWILLAAALGSLFAALIGLLPRASKGRLKGYGKPEALGPNLFDL